MVAHLLWILVIYGIAVALVHMLHIHTKRVESSNRRSAMHYIIITSNHERQVEWILRALSLYALLRGTRVRVTVLDDRSNDNTLRIVNRLADLSGIELSVGVWNSEEHTDVGLKNITSDQDEQRIEIDLRISSEVAPIPYVQ